MSLHEKERIPYLRKNWHDKIFTIGTIIAEKLDGALVNIYLRPNGKTRILSHRKSTVTGAFIDYTAKIPGIKDAFWPTEDSVDLKGEFLIFDKHGNVLPHGDIAGFLHCTDEKAQKRVKELKLQPRIALFELWNHREDETYAQRYTLIKNYIDTHDKERHFIVPRIAESTTDKEKLIEDIKTGKNPRTDEGVIWWSEDGPKKIKFDRKAKVYVHSFYDAKPGKYFGSAVGGIWYSLKKGAAPVGKLGTGFDVETREDMYQNPEKFLGQIVSITHLGQYQNTGAYRSAAFKGLAK